MLGTAAGTQYRTRQRIAGEKIIPGEPCILKDVSNCSVSCKVGDWGPFSVCSEEVTKDDNMRRRRNISTHPRNGGMACPKLAQAKPCPHECPHGKQWNRCGSECVRTCKNPKPVCTGECVAKCECPHTAPFWMAPAKSIGEINGRCVTRNQCPKEWAYLKVSVSLTGMTYEQFDHKARDAFQQAVADQVKVEKSQVVLLRVKVIAAHRRRLIAGVHDHDHGDHDHDHGHDHGGNPNSKHAFVNNGGDDGHLHHHHHHDKHHGHNNHNNGGDDVDKDSLYPVSPSADRDESRFEASSRRLEESAEAVESIEAIASSDGGAPAPAPATAGITVEFTVKLDQIDSTEKDSNLKTAIASGVLLTKLQTGAEAAAFGSVDLQFVSSEVKATPPAAFNLQDAKDLAIAVGRPLVEPIMMGVIGFTLLCCLLAGCASMHNEKFDKKLQDLRQKKRLGGGGRREDAGLLRNEQVT